MPTAELGPVAVPATETSICASCPAIRWLLLEGTYLLPLHTTVLVHPGIKHTDLVPAKTAMREVWYLQILAHTLLSPLVRRSHGIKRMPFSNRLLIENYAVVCRQ